MIKKLSLGLFLLFLLSMPILSALSQQDTGVYAEAIGQANLRAGIGIETDVAGEISTGIRYPVVGRSEFYPWLLLGDPASFTPIGWVFDELVTIYGDVNRVPVSTLNVNALPTNTPPPPPTNANGEPVAIEATPSPIFTATPDFTVYGTFSNEVNLRYGPGVDYERVGVAKAGETYEIVAYHTQFDWVQIVYPGAPDDRAWVFQDLLEITGDIFSTQPVSRTDFSNLPTLTPTQAVLQGSSVQTDGTPVPVSAEFITLGNQLWNFVLEQGFDPATSRFGALYIQNLQTGEELTFGNQFAFSGTSINKVPILMALFQNLDDYPDPQTGIDIANMMICSENVATNRNLARVGGGDEYLGADRVTTFMRQLGLSNTFLTAPFEILGVTPEPPPRPIEYPRTNVDQEKASPNLTNQMTVDEVGYLLSTLYQCGVNESGPLLENMSGFTPQECRKMMHVMANNDVDALLKAGVPANIPVAHKHGWVTDTHGNAALFFTPGGDYVVVMMLHEPKWLVYEQSLATIATVSQQIYNFFNADNPIPEIRDGFIPDALQCNYASSPLISDIVSPYYAENPPFDPDIVSQRPQ